LASCKLVDQRTFESNTSAPATTDIARADVPKLPLVTISFTTPDLDWRPTLRAAVSAAQARKRDVAFLVVTPVPTAASRTVQDSFVAQGRDDAKAVAHEIHMDGIALDNITIGLRGDPGKPAREVRVYAR
jgi:hypothetical protein